MSATGQVPADATPVIAAATVPGAVHLAVPDLGRSREFYERVLGLGLATLEHVGAGQLALGAPGGSPLVVLHSDPAATPRDPRAPGLFHLALLFPTRADLAQALLRVAAASWSLSGASDHLVSEALYLGDPDGNGIELYRDRPRAEWPRTPIGELKMDTLALDLRDLVSASDPDAVPAAEVPAGTRMGHVHLQVADIAAADAFYAGLLGFEVVVRSYPGALFVSAGGYHHHLGLNTWNSRGATPAPAGSLGLTHFEIVVPDRAEFERVLARLTAAGLAVDASPEGDAVRVADPFGTGILLRSA